ncbi:MAG: hypothetical protein JXR65_06800 [Bacteroidales bacterium]|nr:hypothetical protein [Bacteroidales bacterium]
MKKVIFGIVILFLIASCTTQKKVAQLKTKPVQIEQNDSVQHELLTFDARFDNWYSLQKNAAQSNSVEYYENWNRQYVAAWNAKATDPIRNPFFQPIQGYNPTEHYGLKLSRKLFYYFQYVENVLKIPILPGGGPHVVLN